MKPLPTDITIFSKVFEDIGNLIGRPGKHRGSYGEDFIPTPNGSIEISVLSQLVFAHSSDGDLDQTVGGLEAAASTRCGTELTRHNGSYRHPAKRVAETRPTHKYAQGGRELAIVNVSAATFALGFR